MINTIPKKINEKSAVKVFISLPSKNQYAADSSATMIGPKNIIMMSKKPIKEAMVPPN